MDPTRAALLALVAKWRRESGLLAGQMDVQARLSVRSCVDELVDAIAALAAPEAPAGQSGGAAEDYAVARERAAFFAAFQAGLDALDKFGEQHETAEEAWARLYPGEVPPSSLAAPEES